VQSETLDAIHDHNEIMPARPPVIVPAL